MSNYEQALSAARRPPITVPDFEAVANASDVERDRWTEDDGDRRARARRWFLFTAAMWFLYPLLVALLPDPFLPARTVHQILAECTWCLPMVPALLWAAHLSRDRRLRANIFARGIASSTLIFVLMFSFAQFNPGCVFSILVAAAMGRTLQLLGESGLDGSDDRDSEFDPVRFRGILVLTLILACTDAMTLLWTAAMGTVSFIAGFFIPDHDGTWPSVVSSVVTVAMTVLMPINVWGLLRLRTWALFSGMFANIAIGVLAWTDVLAVGDWTAIALVVTAAIQLLLALPILAAALGLGRDGSRQHAWVAPALLWGVVPAAVVVVVVAATTHLMWGLQWNIIPIPR